MPGSIRQVVEYLADNFLNRWKYASDRVNIMAPCPFHDERTPGGFYIHAETGCYFCHGCLARGHLTSLVRGLGAPLELAKVAQNFHGRGIRDSLAQKQSRFIIEQQFTPIEEAFLGIFDYCPVDLVDQGFDEKLLKELNVGYDKDYCRITFPIRSHTGTLMGIAGRTVIDEWPKYLIYKEEDLRRLNPEMKRYKFEKKFFLWNMDKIYSEAYHNGIECLYVVEGYKAALWLIQHGYRNTVALLGVYMSSYQERLITRLGCPVTLFLDNTDMAQHSMLETAQRLQRNAKVTIAEYPEELDEGAQPDDVEPDALEETLNNAQPLFVWRLANGDRLQRANKARTKPEIRLGLREKIEAARSSKKTKGKSRLSVPTPIHTARRKNQRSSTDKRRLRGQDDRGNDS